MTRMINTNQYFSFAVPLTISANISIDPETLQNVFGNPPAAGQVSAVTPNGTLVDLDYWDSIKYKPANADYDKFDFTLTKVS